MRLCPPVSLRSIDSSSIASRYCQLRRTLIGLGIGIAFAGFGCAKDPNTGSTGTGANDSGGSTGTTTGGNSGTGSGGTVGTGGAGTGGGMVMKDPSSYTFNTAGAKNPFPQGHKFSNCTYPLYNTDTVALLYKNWKAKFFVGGRVVRPENSDDTVSEGIAYGMLIGAYMNDQPMFDTLWTYAKSKFNGNGLMNWQIGSGGNVIGQGSASDADEDMAWALLQAGVQWGGTYKADAVKLIDNIWNKEVDTGGGNVLKPGDNFGGAGQTNPSYFAPAYYRAFAKVTSHDWMAVVNSSYSILEKASGSYGLVPNWVNSSGAGVNGPNNDAAGLYYGFDASRTPWRIAHDFCQNNEPRAKTYLDKLSGFFAAQAPTSLGTLKDGYTSQGTAPPALPSKLGTYAAGMAMFGPAGTAAMAGGHDAFLTLVYQALDSNSTQPSKMNINGVYTYYHASWGVLSMLAVSGNFWDME